MEMVAEEVNMKNLPHIENQIQQNPQNELFLITDTGGFNFINNCINKYKPMIWTTLEDPNSSKIAQVNFLVIISANIYLFKVNNRNNRNSIFLLVIVFIVNNFEHISHLFLVSLLLTLNKLAGTIFDHYILIIFDLDFLYKPLATSVRQCSYYSVSLS